MTVVPNCGGTLPPTTSRDESAAFLRARTPDIEWLPMAPDGYMYGWEARIGEWWVSFVLFGGHWPVTHLRGLVADTLARRAAKALGQP